MTDKEILDKLENYLKKQKEEYKSLPNGYVQARAKGKCDGLEMAIFHLYLEFQNRNSL